MLRALVVLIRSIGLICCGHRAVALENLALRQQLAALTRTVKRSQLRKRDRLFWILLATGWREWRTALMVVQPETVLRWHRQWLRRRWADRSKRIRPGAPVLLRPFAHLCTRWLSRIRYRELLESMANCAKWASRSRNGPCRDCSSDDGVIHSPKRGERSWPITQQTWSRWTSSRSRP
jgi:hypothetical protein